MTALTTWSPNNDGWLAPGESGYAFLGTANNQRGLAYGNGHVYLVSRTGGNFVRILDQNTGADLGALDVTGVSGGTFAVAHSGGWRRCHLRSKSYDSDNDFAVQSVQMGDRRLGAVSCLQRGQRFR